MFTLLKFHFLSNCSLAPLLEITAVRRCEPTYEAKVGNRPFCLAGFTRSEDQCLSYNRPFLQSVILTSKDQCLSYNCPFLQLVILISKNQCLSSLISRIIPPSPSSSSNWYRNFIHLYQSCFAMITEIRQTYIPQNKRQIKLTLLPLL